MQLNSVEISDLIEKRIESFNSSTELKNEVCRLCREKLKNPSDSLLCTDIATELEI